MTTVRGRPKGLRQISDSLYEDVLQPGLQYRAEEQSGRPVWRAVGAGLQLPAQPRLIDTVSLARFHLELDVERLRAEANARAAQTMRELRERRKAEGLHRVVFDVPVDQVEGVRRTVRTYLKKFKREGSIPK